MRNARIGAAAAVLFGLMTGAVSAPAQEGADSIYDQASADDLFKKAVAYLKENRFDRACPLLEESYRLDPLPGALFMLASCEAERGRVTAAIKRYNEYLELYQSLSPARKIKQGTRERDARDRIADLVPQVAKVTLGRRSSITAAGTITKLDGVVLPPSSIGVELSVDPGKHVVTIQEPGRPLREHPFEVSPGEAREITLYVAPTLVPSASTKVVGPPKVVAPEPPAGASNRKIAAYAVGGVGGAAFIAGAITAGLAAGEENATTSDGQTVLQNIGFAGIGVGFALIGVAAIVLFTEPSGEPALAAQKGGFQAGFSIARNGSAGLHFQGRW
jgi:hypothetical protein